MDKQQIIAFIEGQIATGKITKTDLLTLAGGEVSAPVSRESVMTPAPQEAGSKKLITIFYVIGAIIALVGVIILVAQNWNEIGFAGRLLVTLGISVVTYISAMLLNKPHQNTISSVFFTIAAALAPIGAMVMIAEASGRFTFMNQFVTAIILFIIFGAALFISKRAILMLITVAFASWAYYALLLEVFSFNYDMDYMKWATMLLGASYLLIGYWYKKLTSDSSETSNQRYAVAGILSGLGTLGILTAGITVGGFFDLIYIALIFAAFYGGVYLKSRSMLLFGAIFLVAHIIKITSKYFAQSIGWPIALILVGFLVIGVGYLTFYLNKRFISTK